MGLITPWRMGLITQWRMGLITQWRMGLITPCSDIRRKEWKVFGEIKDTTV